MPTKKPEAKKAEFVTQAEFSKMTEILSTLVTAVTDLKGRTATVAEVKEEVEIKKAKPDSTPVPESWDETAREIIGEALDHVEMLQPRGGGTLFTIVIKPEFSNAPKDYLAFYKVDRRTKEIGSEGIAGVENYCKLVRANLKRPAEKR